MPGVNLPKGKYTSIPIEARIFCHLLLDSWACILYVFHPWFGNYNQYPCRKSFFYEKITHK